MLPKSHLIGIWPSLDSHMTIVPFHRNQARAAVNQLKIWINMRGPCDMVPKHASGKYELDLNGKHLETEFLSKIRFPNHQLRLCMCETVRETLSELRNHIQFRADLG